MLGERLLLLECLMVMVQGKGKVQFELVLVSIFLFYIGDCCWVVWNILVKKFLVFDNLLI